MHPDGDALVGSGGGRGSGGSPMIKAERGREHGFLTGGSIGRQQSPRVCAFHACNSTAVALVCDTHLLRDWNVLLALR